MELLKLFQDPHIQAEDFSQCFRGDSDAALGRFFDDRAELNYKHVRELGDTMLTWSGFDFHGDNGYFLWLVIGTFALFQKAQAGRSREKVSQENGRLHIVAGFEELFAHFATV